MDPASLAFSISSLLSVIDSCFKLYSDIRKSNERDGDVHASSIRLQVETFRLKAFQEVATNGTSADLFKAPILKDLCDKVIALMEKDVNAIRTLLTLHEDTVTQDSDKGIKQVAGRASAKVKRTWRGRTWAAHDKERLNELIARVREHNDWLMSLIPAARRRRTDFEATSAAISSNHLSTLETVQEATVDQSPIISRGAEVKKMTILARGNVEDFDGYTSGPAKHQIKVEDFTWLPSKWLRLTRSHSHDAITLEEASRQEKATAIYRARPASTTSTSHQQPSAQPVMVEWRESFRSEESHEKYAHRLDYLVEVLRKLSASISQSFSAGRTEGDFDILHCLGWTTTSKDYDRIGLVFSFPQNTSPPRIPQTISKAPDLLSLNDWMVRTRKDKSIDPPPLGLRFDIARGLALALGNLISVGWIHKELRSHNVLFFGKLGSGSTLSKPYLSGYTYARSTKETIKDVSSLNASPEYALYRPSVDVMAKYNVHMAQVDDYPQKTQSASCSDSEETTTNRKQDAARPTSALDIYGLGIVLLEIGLWRTIQSLQSKSSSQESFVKHELDGLVQSLSYRMGDLYCGVVKQSLKLGNWVESRTQETEFFGSIIEDLALCRA